MGEIDVKEEKQRSIAAKVSLVAGFTIMVGKFYAFSLTGSLAVFSDALESIINVITAAFALFVVYYSAKPVDKDHPYGHGKIEYFSEAFEGGLITFAAGFIIIDAIAAFFTEHQVRQLNVGLYIVFVAGVLNLLLGMYLIYKGKKTKSVALKASGHHVISDFWTSFGVFVGLFLVEITGLVVLDIISALAVGLFLGYTGIRLVLESVDGLLDKEDLGLLKKLAVVFTKHAKDGIIQVHHAKVIRSGWYNHIDAHLVVPEYWTIDEVHDNVVDFEKAVLKECGFKGEINYHLDPCRKAYCKVCEVKNCPIRQHEFEHRMPVDLEQLRAKEEPEEFR